MDESSFSTKLEVSSPARQTTSSSTTSYKTSYKSFTSGNHGHGDHEITLQEITEAKEIFNDMEAAYRKYKYKLDEMKKEHSREVSIKMYIFKLCAEML